jgi:hypothetical protein
MEACWLRGRVDLPGLREQDCQIAARTYRALAAARRPAARIVSDAMVINAIFDARFTTDPSGRRRLTA